MSSGRSAHRQSGRRLIRTIYKGFYCTGRTPDNHVAVDRRMIVSTLAPGTTDGCSTLQARWQRTWPLFYTRPRSRVRPSVGLHPFKDGSVLSRSHAQGAGRSRDTAASPSRPSNVTCLNRHVVNLAPVRNHNAPYPSRRAPRMASSRFRPGPS